MTEAATLIGNVKNEMDKQAAEQVDFIKTKLRWMPHVIAVRHTNGNGVLVELVPSKAFFFISFLGVFPNGSRNYPDALTERFEAEQPHCAIGTYGPDTDLKAAIALADEGNATWTIGSPGVPINRVIEEIIKLDYGVRVIGCYF